MHLVTTAIKDYWPSKGAVVLLGEWCQRIDQEPSQHDPAPAKVAYHWDNREKLLDDYRFLQKIYETAVPKLASILNTIHGEEHSLRYWRIIIGPFLYFFLSSLLDRYRSIENAQKRGDITTTIVSPDYTHPVPANFSQFAKSITDDAMNQDIYGLIIRTFNSFHYTVANNVSLNTSEVAAGRGSFLNRAKRRILESMPKSDIVLLDTYLKAKDVTRLQLSLRALPSLGDTEVIQAGGQPDPAVRQKLAIFDDTQPFERILNRLIPFLLPISYIESFKDIRLQIKKKLHNSPRLIVTAVAYEGNDPFKIWAAGQVEKGVPFIGIQHGGHYGVSLFALYEWHEINIYDRFLSWGWSDDSEEKSKVTPCASGKLHASKKTIKANPAGGILMALLGLPRYAYLLFSAPMGPQLLEFFEDQKNFFETLHADIKRQLYVRPYPNDFGWQQKDRLLRACPNMRFSDPSENFLVQLNRHRLFIGTYNATTILETLSANFPTVMFWKSEHWELRDSAQPYFNELVHAGILHYSASSAADLINKIWEKLDDWWNSEKVQKARLNFIQKYARADDTWRKDFACILKSSINTSLEHKKSTETSFSV